MKTDLTNNNTSQYADGSLLLDLTYRYYNRTVQMKNMNMQFLISLEQICTIPYTMDQVVRVRYCTHPSTHTLHML